MATQNEQGTNLSSYRVGAKVKLLINDLDNDENGLERKIPAGTHGAITAIDESAETGFHYHVEFANGGWLIFYTDELASHLELI